MTTPLMGEQCVAELRTVLEAYGAELRSYDVLDGPETQTLRFRVALPAYPARIENIDLCFETPEPLPGCPCSACMGEVGCDCEWCAKEHRRAAAAVAP